MPKSPGEEIIWPGSFNNGNISSTLVWMEIRTFGDLARTTHRQLLDRRLNEGEIGIIRNQLILRGLNLADESETGGKE